jgi:hypothetical protein
MTMEEQQTPGNCQARACLPLTSRRTSGDTTTILSRIGSRGRVVTSTITWLLSRTSVTPPCAPAGAASTARVSSTTSPIFKLSMVAIASIVGPGISGNQSRRSFCICIVPCSNDRGNSLVCNQLEGDATTSASVLFNDSAYWSRQHSLGDQTPNEINVLLRYPKDPPPFRAVAILRKDPISQLASFTPSILCAWERLTKFGWPHNAIDVRKCRRAGGLRVSSPRVINRAKGAQA